VALAGNDDSNIVKQNFEYDIHIGIDNLRRNRPEDVSKLTFKIKKARY